MLCDTWCYGGRSPVRRVTTRFHWLGVLLAVAAVAATNVNAVSKLDAGAFENENGIESCIERGIGNGSGGCNNNTVDDADASLPADPVVARQPTTRIVGGRDAPKNRYPYFVSLQEIYNGTHRCGGSLVAPDVVVTAAHCQSNIRYAQVGKYYVSEPLFDDDDDYDDDEIETFEVLGPMHPHPLYNLGVSFSYDVLLFRLNRKSTNQFVRINTDPDLLSVGGGGSSAIGGGGPQDARESSHHHRDGGIARSEQQHGNYGLNLTVIGIGSTNNGKFGTTYPRVLQETTTSFVPNRVCRRSKAPDLDDNYQNLISDDMMCAFEDGQDACQGECEPVVDS